MALLGAGLAGCAMFPPLPPPRLEGPWAVHRIESPEIRESSGLVRSRTHPGVFWTHNDSGDTPRLFAISAEGRAIAEFRVQGARNGDWEDIAIDDAGNLYVADVGNNLNRRRSLRVYRLSEPDPFGEARSVPVERVLRFRYADQRGFPEWTRLNFDAEAMFWLEGSLFILTKHRSDARSTVYRLPVEASPEEREIAPVAELDLGGRRRLFFGNTTAADVSEDGRVLALLTYAAITLWERVEGNGGFPFRLSARIALAERRTRQAESVAWDGAALIVGNEQGHLFRIPDPLAPGLERYPPR